MIHRFLQVALISLAMAAAKAVASDVDDTPVFHSNDSLAPRDENGLLHQMAAPNATDLEPRYHWRPLYWLEGGQDLARQPAYVGALQRDLARLGYYCGPIDGIFTDEVADAIARMQKNYSMRVTGTVTIPVRRALHLP